MEDWDEGPERHAQAWMRSVLKNVAVNSADADPEPGQAPGAGSCRV